MSYKSYKISSIFAKSLFCDFIIALSLSVFFIFLVFINKPTRIGDGGEYYALYITLNNTCRPFMSSLSWADFERFVRSGEVSHMPHVEALKSAFPALSLGSTSDFNHFWFYSLLAALVGGLLKFIGIHFSIHISFIVIHWLLLCITCIVTRHFFAWKGILSIILLTLISPILWYTDKVHTEFFTYCVTLIAVVFFIRQYYILAFLFLACASTQNISFGPIAIIPLIIDFLSRKDNRYSLSEVTLVFVGISLTLIHPIYYSFRFGVITPQLLAGGADVGGNLKYFYIWIIDPDVGLLPNWPLGIGIIGLIILMRKRFRYVQPNLLTINIKWWIFLLSYLSISLFAQSSTENLNSGATSGLSRYALWYIPLFFPFLLKIITALDFICLTKVKRYSLYVFIIGCLFFNLLYYRPTLPENYIKPTLVSYWIQKILPSIYNPPIEVFAERFSNRPAEMPGLINQQVLAIIGPDCRKILILNFPYHNNIAGRNDCFYMTDSLVKFLKQQISINLTSESISENLKKSKYIRLTEDEAVQLTNLKP